MIKNTSGKSDVLSFIVKATNILKEFYEYTFNIKTSYLEKNKIRIIEVAATITTSDTKMVET